MADMQLRGARRADMRVLVCGGRKFGQGAGESRALYRAMNAAHAHKPITTLIHGAASGADSLAGAWAASQRDIEIIEFPANWKTHGRAAGHIRNARMLEEGKPDGIIAFPGGPGTADMTRRARRAGLPVWTPLKGLASTPKAPPVKPGGGAEGR